MNSNIAYEYIVDKDQYVNLLIYIIFFGTQVTEIYFGLEPHYRLER